MRTPALALACSAFATLAAAAAPAAAQSFTLTFGGVPIADPAGVGVTYVNNCYTEAGVRVTVAGVACTGADAAIALATYTPADPLGYTGSAALFNNLGTSFDLTTPGASGFLLNSVDLAPIFPFNPSFIVTVVGTRLGGGTLSQTLTLGAGATGLSRFALTNFSGVAFSSVRFTPGAPDFAVQFDNVTGSVVPEPATLVLFGAGALGLAAAARRRRAA